MEQHLKFTIGSTFSSEGFTKLKTSVQNVNTMVTRAASASQKAAMAIGQLDTSGSKAATACSGLVTALMLGGVQGAIMTASMMAVNYYLQEMREEMEAVTKKAAELKAAATRAFNDTASDIKNGFAKEIADVASRFDTITKSATAFTNAMNGLSSSQSAGNVINLEIEKFNAMLEAGTEAERKRIEATYELKIAEEKAAASSEEQSRKVTLATNTRIIAEQKLAAYHEEQQKLAAQIAKTQEAYEQAIDGEVAGRKDIAKLLKDLEGKQEDLAKKAQQATLDVTNATLAEKTAVQNQTNALAQSQLATKKASVALDKLSTAVPGFVENEFVAAYEAEKASEELKEAERTKTEMLKESADAEAELKESSERLKTAQEKLAAAVYAYESNYAQNQIWESIAGGSGSRNVAGIWQQLNNATDSQRIQEGAAVIAGERAIAAGTVRTVEALRQVEQQAMRDTREQMSSKETSQMMQEAARAERLRGMSDKALSQADREWLQKYDSIEQANNKQKDEIWKQKALADAESFARKRAYDNINNIYLKMKQLGLK